MTQKKRMEFVSESEAREWAEENDARIVWGRTTQSGYYAEVEIASEEA